MPRPKQFVKEARLKSSKPAAQTPQTTDEYLAAGVDFEEAGEKWRAGDAAKSTRFFVRAIDTYDEALRKFPLSFDLAYNKARIQYELTQYPRLAAQLPGSLLDLLKTALESSRAASDLRQDNADVLFNTAQVLTSLVEALTEDRSAAVSKDDALRLLEESIELFQRCLTLQEFHYAESQALQEETAQDAQAPLIKNPVGERPLTSAMSGPVSVTLTSSSNASDSSSQSATATASSASSSPAVAEEERWATIIEPVTNDTLLDTVLAQLETLTLLAELITTDRGRGLAWIEEYSTGLLTTKLPAYTANTDRDDEAALTRANFLAGLANANFRCDRMDADTYQRALQDAFDGLDLDHDPEGLCDRAEALIAYSSALGTSSSSSASAPSSRWAALTAALDALSTAARQPTAQNLTAIHLLRGDVELLRYRLGRPPIDLPAAAAASATLLKNAATYYRGAGKQATAATASRHVEDVDEWAEAVVKLALAEALAGQKSGLGLLLSGGNGGGEVVNAAARAKSVMQDAVEAGLVATEWLVGEGFVL